MSINKYNPATDTLTQVAGNVGNIINDTTASTSKVYSSSKVDDLLAELLDDVKIKYTILEANTDFDTLVIEDNASYYQVSNANYITCLNTPYTQGVSIATSGGNLFTYGFKVIKQIYINQASNLFVRSGYWNNGDILWNHDWKEVVTADYLKYTNPNLLDNPWFSVNQREQSSYTGVGYTVDRWQISSQPTSNVVVNSDGSVTFNTDTKSYFYQRIDANLSTLLLGNTLTLSIMLSDGTIHSGTFTLTSTTDGRIWILDSTYYIGTFWSGSNIITRLASNLTTSSSITVKAMKLELGSVSTLANDTLPNYSTELIKCKTSKVSSTDTYANKVLATNDNIVKTKTVSVTVQSVHPNFSIGQLSSNITVLSMNFVSTTSPYFLGLIVPFVGTNDTWYGSIVGVADESNVSAFLSKTLDVKYTYIEN